MADTRKWIAGIVLALTISFRSGLTVDHECPPMAVKQIAVGLNLFSSSLDQVSRKMNPNENLLISPLSISTAVAMCLAGARGGTAQQIRDAFHSRGPCKRTMHGAVGSLSQKVKDHNKDTLKLANQLFVAQRFSIRTKFRRMLSNRFGAKVSIVDFASVNVSQHINQWVEESSNGAFVDLIPEGSTNKMTQLLLVSVVHLQSDWQHRFDVALTKSRPFYTAAGPVEVPMMRIHAAFRVANLAECKCRVLELPYAGRSLSMLIVLPNQRDGLQAVEAQWAINSKGFNALRSRMRNLTLEVVVPKFQLRGSLDVKSALEALGVTDLFQRSVTDLSAIAEKKRLFVSDIFHQNYLRVDENGSQASSAIAIAFQSRIFRPQPQPFIADRPFMFFILDNESQLVLFSGRLIDPSIT